MHTERRRPLRDPVAEPGEDGAEHRGAHRPVLMERRGEVGRRTSPVEAGAQCRHALIPLGGVEGPRHAAVAARQETFAAQHLVETARSQREVQPLEPVLARGLRIGHGVVAHVQHAVARTPRCAATTSNSAAVFPVP